MSGYELQHLERHAGIIRGYLYDHHIDINSGRHHGLLVSLVIEKKETCFSKVPELKIEPINHLQ